jgi:hypothetical protein
MKKFNYTLLAASIASLATMHSAVAAESIAEALKGSKATGDFLLRYEDVSTDAGDTDLLSLRSRFGFVTDTFNGFSFTAEAEDVTFIAGIDGPLAYEPEVTEIDQAFLQYKTDTTTTKVGRQVITLDGHRFVGHVGFRQDRQTFDAVRTQFSPAKDLSVDLSYIFQRNRIFGEALDAESSDALINASYKTSIGKLVGYAYLLDDESRDEQSDTYGVSLTGATGDSTKFLYALEYATQSITDSGIDFDTDYMFAEVGISVSGVTAKLGYEVLGSDDGAASFTTPLATLHKFNGWNDIFLGGSFDPAAMPNGLEDTYLSVATKVNGIALAANYHDYSANEGSASYGDEIGIVASKGFNNGITAGIKYSSYSADTFSIDTDKLWVWAGYKF